MRLAQVVSNLLTNAARYTQEGGHVQVRCRAGEQDIEIEVEDNGPGIAPELVSSVFDMFVQAQPGSGGLGIGLTLVRRLVALHGGSVAVAPAPPDGGSIFVVRLPLAQTEGRALVQSIPPSSQDRAPLRIAVVDDNDDVREML